VRIGSTAARRSSNSRERVAWAVTLAVTDAMTMTCAAMGVDDALNGPPRRILE
jgi:hypothetical protein